MFKIKFFLLFSLFIFFSSLDILAPHNSEALCIKNERANLRKGPGIQYEKLWEVFKYMPFKKLGFKGKWKRIQDVDGDIYSFPDRFKNYMIDGFYAAKFIRND